MTGCSSLRELNLRRRKGRIAGIAAVLRFRALLRIPVALDRHQPVDRPEIDHHRTLLIRLFHCCATSPANEFTSKSSFP